MDAVVALLEEAMILHQQQIEALRRERASLQQVVANLKDHISGLENIIADMRTKRAQRVRRRSTALSKRETQVLILIACCFSNDQIAERLNISFGTARTHTVHILKKLGVSSRIQVALWAWRHNVISVDEAWERVMDLQWRELPTPNKNLHTKEPHAPEDPVKAAKLPAQAI